MSVNLNFQCLEDMPKPSARNWALYFKPTSACNLSCSFCYNPKRASKSEFFNQVSGSEAFAILDSLALADITSSCGQNVHFIWHGGEYTMMSYEWLDTFMAALRSTYPGMAVSSMSNMQTPGFVEKSQMLIHKHQVGFSTSRNEFVCTDTWEQNIRTCQESQGNIHFNSVFGPTDTTDFLESSQKFLQSFDELNLELERVCLKYERMFPAENADTYASSNFYQRTSELTLPLLQEVIKDPCQVLRYMTFLYPILALEYCRRFKHKMFLRGFFCGAACYRDMLVIDQQLDVGLCTKAMKQTTIGSLSTDTTLKDLLHTEKYYTLLKRIFQSDCQNDLCEYAYTCSGGCPYLPEFDDSGECANSRSLLRYLQQLSDATFMQIIDLHPWKDAMLTAIIPIK